MKKNDLKKYPWLTSFLISEISDFKGVHNVDIGEIHFSYTTPIKSKNDLLIKIDSIAKSENWTLVTSSVVSREYSKRLNHFQSDTVPVLVKISIDTIENKVYFNVK